MVADISRCPAVCPCRAAVRPILSGASRAGYDPVMTGNGTDDPGTVGNDHANTTFGPRLRAERMARRWSLAEAGRQLGVNAGHLSRIESSKRPPTANLAIACDRVWPDLGGWFSADFESARAWLASPPWFRPWLPHEDAATEIRSYDLATVQGLLQTEAYARALFSVSPDATPERTEERTVARLERQRKFFSRKPSPSLLCLIDELALRRDCGPGVMAEQVRHLADAAQWPSVTLQLLPPALHAGLLSSIMFADDAAYVDTSSGGHVYQDDQTVRVLVRRFDTIRSEALPRRQTLRRLGEIADELA